jgi:hypothetical protein
MGNLSNQYISQSFQSLLHLGSDNTASATFAEIQDALGNGVGVFVNTTGNLRVTNSISASAVSASTISGFGNPVSYSASVSDQLKALENITSSLINATGSYATTGSNNFIGNQTITGDLDVSGQLRVSSIYTTQETASVIFSSGSNILGDSITDTQTLNGLVRVSGSSQITGSMGISANLNVKGAISSSTITGMGNVTDYSASVFNQFYALNQYDTNNDIKWATLEPVTQSLINQVYSIEQFTASANPQLVNLSTSASVYNTKNTTLAPVTSSLIISSSNLAVSASIYNTKWDTLGSYTASVDTKFTTIGSLTGSYATTGSNTFSGKQTMNAGLFVPKSASSSSINSISCSLVVNPIDIVLTASTSLGQPGAIQLQGSSTNGVRVIGFMNAQSVGTGAPLWTIFNPVSSSATSQYLLGVGYTAISGAVNLITGQGGFLSGSIFARNPLNIGGGAAIVGNLVSYSDESGNGAIYINSKTTIDNNLSVTGSVTISSVLKLADNNPLPAGSDGSMAVSGSNLYFYSGSAWNKVTLG